MTSTAPNASYSEMREWKIVASSCHAPPISRKTWTAPLTHRGVEQNVLSPGSPTTATSPRTCTAFPKSPRCQGVGETTRDGGHWAEAGDTNRLPKRAHETTAIFIAPPQPGSRPRMGCHRLASGRRVHLRQPSCAKYDRFCVRVQPGASIVLPSLPAG